MRHSHQQIRLCANVESNQRSLRPLPLRIAFDTVMLAESLLTRAAQLVSEDLIAIALPHLSPRWDGFAVLGNPIRKEAIATGSKERIAHSSNSCCYRC